MESNAIAAGSHTLFTVPGAKNLTIDKVEIAGAGGTQLGVRVTTGPKTFALYQNRPNPVRTGTDIVYAIPTDAKVSLKIYDAAGMLVQTLVNEWKTRGFHSASWDANEVANGVYFYKLDAGKYSATRKLIRMR
jgi:flagellar hook assembly protein FlgD